MGNSVSIRKKLYTLHRINPTLLSLMSIEEGKEGKGRDEVAVYVMDWIGMEWNEMGQIDIGVEWLFVSCQFCRCESVK
jgi:hypothetical protein